MKAIILNTSGARYIDLPEDSEMQFGRAMQAAIGCRDMGPAGSPDHDHDAYADDEGMLTLGEGTSLVRTTFFDEWLPGNIVITGIDHATGQLQDCSLTPEDAEAMLVRRTFYSRLSDSPQLTF
ncbi:hypothetical protein VRRI112168_02905 [Vreelandella rituensis]|uniref:DUF3846 domain-containing protein n=1 Tax=Vreelandella rituensis TaxID=2282306 RepID=A0A368U9U2_9GAMM|nr:hypothetical protein [Halomonas rituensis]RCV93691.1 hypothetical protein DU506_00625 [Halomonas rituensis]